MNTTRTLENWAPSAARTRASRTARLLVAALAYTATGLSQAQAQPAPSAPQPIDTAEQIVAAFDALFKGPHAGLRAVHSKGLLVEGHFTPTEDAAVLSRAAHFQRPVPVLVRFSNFAGVPGLADGHAAGSPRGMSVKFMLPDGGDTDIVAHSYDGFPAGTPEDFLGFLRAVASPDKAVLERYLASHPPAKTFVDHPKPAPVSFATEAYFGVDAFRFTNGAGVGHYGRYRLQPVAGTAHLSPGEAEARAPGYLADEMSERLRQGSATFRLLVQIAAEGDPIDDATKAWPESRRVVDLGVLTLRAVAAQGDGQQGKLLFTPLNLVAGIAPSKDPLLAARNRAYRVSHARRNPPTQ